MRVGFVFWFRFKETAQFFIFLRKQLCVYVPQIQLYFKNNLSGQLFADQSELYLVIYRFQGHFHWKKSLDAKWAEIVLVLKKHWFWKREYFKNLSVHLRCATLRSSTFLSRLALDKQMHQTMDGFMTAFSDFVVGAATICVFNIQCSSIGVTDENQALCVGCSVQRGLNSDFLPLIFVLLTINSISCWPC